MDGCPSDANKVAAGTCGCGVADTDTDGDSTPDCNDGCPSDASKLEAGACGCGSPDTDSDGDSTPDCQDLCPNDAQKISGGVCGCGVLDTDADSDGTPDCTDGCPNDATKTASGLCGCGVADTDTDSDGVADCVDSCPNDPSNDVDGDSVCGGVDNCASVANPDQANADGDALGDACDGCPSDAAKAAPGVCGCGFADTDADADGTADCNDPCPSDPNKTSAGSCGCGVPDTDTDGDGTADCHEGCANGDCGWRRVGHRAVQSPAISDGAARPHSYFSVVAFDSGEVVPLNDFYHPQLFEYEPSTAALVSRAFMFPHEGLGNEDDIRWRIRAHKGATAAESLVFWHVIGWEEISDENGSLARDAAVFSTRPIQESPGVMPRAQARVVNMGADASLAVGPYRAGVDYDPANHILFASMERTDQSVGHALFQAFSVDLATGQFVGRATVGAPGPRYRFTQAFLRVDPDHGLALIQSDDPWDPDHPILYLTTYTPAAGDRVATFGAVQQLEASALAAPGLAVREMPRGARDAVFVEQDGHVWAVVAAEGLFVFDLGPVGGPYTLGPPVGSVPLSFRAEAIQRVGDELVVSSHGLHVYATSSVLAVRGYGAPAATVYRLPYTTYELDVATIEGRQTLFLASGPEGLDVFEWGPMPESSPDAGALDSSPRRDVDLREGVAEILLETGDGLRTLGPPVTNDAGALAFWAVTAAGHEVVVLVPDMEPPTVIADTGRDPYRALGRPSLASDGRVAFWAAMDDGTQSIVLWDGAAYDLAVTDAETVALDQPELSDAGAVLFAEVDAAGASTLVVCAEDGTVSTVFADDDVWELPSDDGAPPAQYDTSPSGEVVFVKKRRSDGPLVLSWWDGTQVFDVASDDREVNFPRMVVSGVAAYRSWASEVIRLRVLPAQAGGGPGVPETVTDRHELHVDGYFGNFGTAAALSVDDVIFIAPGQVPPSVELDELGNALHRYTAGGILPGTLVGTDDPVDGATVRNVLFVDAATVAHGAAFVLELEHADGAVSYALLRLPL